jgi:hypothetical protein
MSFSKCRWFNLRYIESPGCEDEKEESLLINVDNLDYIRACSEDEWPLYPIKTEVCFGYSVFWSLDSVEEILGTGGVEVW